MRPSGRASQGGHARIADGSGSHIIAGLQEKCQMPLKRCGARWRARMLMDVVEIQKILPHRYAFLMVDAILEVERLKRIVGVRHVSINESHFQGDFLS